MFQTELTPEAMHLKFNL